MSKPIPSEYLPMPDGYTKRAADLQAAGYTEEQAHWMAACEASGAITRTERSHRDLFWYGDTPDEQREAWDEIAEKEGRRFYFHQRKDTLVGYLAYGRHKARLTAQQLVERSQRLTEFVKKNGLWDVWVQENAVRRQEQTP